MNINSIMTEKPEVLDSNCSIRDAAKRMRELDIGFMPLRNNDKVVGIVTDRDLVTKGLAQVRSPDDDLTSLQSDNLQYCVADSPVDDALQEMQDSNVQRLLVFNNDDAKEFVGVISLGDIANNCESPAIKARIADCCKHYH